MIYTSEQYQKLCESIATGTLKVKYGDREITYRSLSEMFKIKSEIESYLTPKKKVYHINPHVLKGLHNDY